MELTGLQQAISHTRPRAGPYGGISKNRRPRHAWRDLLEQLQPFAAHAVFEQHETGGVAARPCQAVDEAGGVAGGGTGAAGGAAGDWISELPPGRAEAAGGKEAHGHP
jgi:hypothetical protein